MGGGWGCQAGGIRWGTVWAWKPGGPASPFPGQASSCQDGTQRASSSLVGRNRAQGQSRLSGNHRLGCADGGSSDGDVMTPTPFREPPGRPRPQRWAGATFPLPRCSAGGSERELPCIPAGRSAAERHSRTSRPGPQGPAPANRKPTLVSRIHPVLPLLPALLSVTFSCAVPCAEPSPAGPIKHLTLHFPM